MVNLIMQTKYLLKTLSLCIIFVSGNGLAEQLSPAPYKTMDNNGVNVISGHVSPTLTDISIGGSMGLTHTISATAGNFGSELIGNWGPVEKFRGGIHNVKRSDNSGESNDLYVLRAFGPSGGADFKINLDGSYEDVNVAGNTLTHIAGQGYVFTTSGGTENHYHTGNSNPITNARNSVRMSLSKIVYPNGFIITITKSSGSMEVPIYSVNTNTGFQLKYFYQPDTRPVPSSVANAVAQNVNGQPMYVDTVNWHAKMPKHIKGINNAIEYCTPTSASCNLTGAWPTVKYEWPAGMPKAFWVGDNVFKITDAMDRVTEYKHSAIDTVVYIDGQPYNYPPNERFVPRIVEIKDATDNVSVMKYEYSNKGTPGGGAVNGVGPRWMSNGSAVLNSAHNNNVTVGYNIGTSQRASGGQVMRLINYGGGYKGVNYVYFNPYFQVIETVDTRETRANLSTDYKNRLLTFVDKLTGVGYAYKYDDELGNVTPRGNVISITEAPGSSSPITQTAVYPSYCYPYNRKFCNKATSITDGNGNTSFYEYHSPSGQIEEVTLPPNEDGISKVTRYAYTKHYATYKINSASPSTSPDGIWLLTSEKSCINSPTSGDSCTGNDEVEITYAYDSANLFLIEQSVISGSTTRRTCYRYDIYGNKIGVTQPKANPSTCVY
ncbi:hypothetical protein CXF95_26010 [Paraglaciecola sp. MB-3u-78]|jgi:hypothetical protein|nr:hypothetical protein CXF95_26010 [Paraglaciecola sp. MB-3u-78]